MSSLLLSLVPPLVAGLVLILAGAVLWMQRPRPPIVVALVVLLVFEGDLQLIRTLLLFPEVPTVALRLWPLFSLVVTASACAFLCLLYQRRVPARTLDAWLSSVIGAAALIGILALTMPSLYWGNGAHSGPLAFIDGLRMAALAGLGFLLLRGRSFAASPILPVLGAAFLLAPMFWVTIDLLYVRILGADLAHLHTGPAHWGRLMAVVPIVAALTSLTLRAYGKRQAPHGRRFASKILLLLLIPPLASIIVLHGILWGAVPPAAADALIVTILGPVWLLAPAFIVAAAAAKMPGALSSALTTRQALGPRDDAPSGAVVVQWDAS